MKKMWICILMFGLLFLNTCQTEAFILLDTGINTREDLLVYHAERATKFSLNKATTITSIEMYLSGASVVSGQLDNPQASLVRMRIYGDAYGYRGNVPNGDIQYETLFELPRGHSEILDDYGWRGVTGLSLNLPEGDYWAAFHSGSLDGSISPYFNQVRFKFGIPGTSRSAIGNSAGFDYIPVGQGETCDSDGCRPNGEPIYNYSLRVEAQPVVPEPASIFLFGAGLLGAFIRRRSRS